MSRNLLSAASRHASRKRRCLGLGRRPVSTFGYTQAEALVYSRYGEPAEELRLHRYSIAPAYAKNLTLRFLASPINPSDVNQIQGTYPSKPVFATTLGTPQPSAVAGNEGVAEVVATGSGVKGVKRGDWVIMARAGLGTWRTYASADSEEDVIAIDNRDGITAVQAGTVSVNPCTAYRMLRDFVHLDPARGDWFIQNGANSGVGRAAIQLARIWGYKSINVIRDRAGGVEDLKTELRELGATVVVTEDELLDTRSFAEKLGEWTHGGREKVRLGLNCVGGKAAMAMARFLSSSDVPLTTTTNAVSSSDGAAPQDPRPKLVTYGAMSRQGLTIPASMLIFQDVSVEGFWVSRWAAQHPALKKQTVDDVLDLTRRGDFREGPVREVRWPGDANDANNTAAEDTIKKEVQSTLQGYRGAKAVFVFP